MAIKSEFVPVLQKPKAAPTFPALYQHVDKKFVIFALKRDGETLCGPVVVTAANMHGNWSQVTDWESSQFTRLPVDSVVTITQGD